MTSNRHPLESGASATARRLPRAAVVGAVVALHLGGWGVTSARAVAPDVQGWWTQTDPGGLPVTPPQLPGVPADGLLLQAGGQSPLAYSALSYPVAGGQTATTLTLVTAPGETTAPTSAIDLCPLSSPSFSPEQGGSIANAPAYDCTKKVTATLDADGVTFKADVGALVSGDTLAIALVPSTSTFRVVLAKPSGSSLATTGGSTFEQPALTPEEPVSQPASGPAPLAEPQPGLDSSGNAVVAGAPPALTAPGVTGTLDPVVVDADPEVASQPATAGNAVPLASVGRSTTEKGSRSTVLLLIAGMALAAGFWNRAGAQTERVALADGAEDDLVAEPTP